MFMNVVRTPSLPKYNSKFFGGDEEPSDYAYD
jgi:hypothetical protein